MLLLRVARKFCKLKRSVLQQGCRSSFSFELRVWQVAQQWRMWPPIRCAQPRFIKEDVCNAMGFLHLLPRTAACLDHSFLHQGSAGSLPLWIQMFEQWCYFYINLVLTLYVSEYSFTHVCLYICNESCWYGTSKGFHSL
jgi:hypothetical protein